MVLATYLLSVFEGSATAEMLLGVQNVGANPAGGYALTGNLGFLRFYPEATSGIGAPGNAPEAGAAMALEFEDSLVDTAQPSRALSSVGTGSITYTNTPAGGGPPPPPSFSLSANPVAHPVIQGQASVSTAIGVVPLNGFGSGTAVALDCVSPPAGITCGTGTATAGQAGTVSMTLATNLAGGTHTVSVRGTGGGATATVGVAVNVTVPGFTLTAQPATPVVSVGTAAAVVTVQAGMVGGFSSGTPITLTCVNPPAGITCGAATVTGAQAGNLALNLAVGLASGSYGVTVQGSGGGRTAGTVLELQVRPPGSYGLSLTPATGSVTPGTATVATVVSVTGTGGWPAGALVGLSCPGAPGGITCNAAAATGGQAASLVMNLPAGLGTGSYTVPVVGNHAGLTATVNYGLTVTVPPNSGRSLVLTAGKEASMTLSAPQAVWGWDVKARVHGLAVNTYAPVFDFGHGAVRVMTNASMKTGFEISTPWGYCPAAMNLDLPSDYVVRLVNGGLTVYDRTESTILVQYGCYQVSPAGPHTVYGMKTGATSGTMKVGWIRGTVGNWEFEDNLNSGSGHPGLVWQGGGAPVYDYTPPQ